MAPRRQYPQRTAARVTRSQRGSPLYAGLTSARPSAIRRDGLTLIRSSRSESLPEPPDPRRYSVTSFEYTAPRRLVRVNNAILFFPASYCHAALANRFWHQFFTPAIAESVFPRLDLVDYHAMRQSCRYFALQLDPYLPGINTVPAHHGSITAGCQNYRMPNKAMVLRTDEGRPRTSYWRFWDTTSSQPTGLGPCANDLGNIARAFRNRSDNSLPYMKICEGPRLGFNHGNRMWGSQPPHAANLLVCAICVYRTWRAECFSDCEGEHKLPLCFECSKAHYSTDRDGSYYDRNTCACGMLYVDMRAALPISNVQDDGSCTTVGGLDHRYTFRECLECGGHVKNPSRGCNYDAVNTYIGSGWVVVDPGELTCI